MTGTDRQDLKETTVGIEAHRERMTVEVVIGERIRSHRAEVVEQSQQRV